MTAPTKRIRKTQVRSALDRESARLVKIVRELGEEGAARPLLGTWSARDVLAHCVYWQGMLVRMMGVHDLPPPNWIPRLQTESEIGTDELNRLTVEHYRPFALQKLIADFQFTADLVRRVVDDMKEQNLMVLAGEPWAADMPVHEAIAGETHGHWKEHADELEKALATVAVS